MSAPRKTHCKQGHELTEENSYYTPSTGFRKCRICSKEYARQYDKEWRAQRRDGVTREYKIAPDHPKGPAFLQMRKLGETWDAIIAQSAAERGVKGTAQAYGLEMQTVASLVEAA